MTRMTSAQADAVWDAIDGQRARTADLLVQLTAEQWDHPSLCRGWSVRHVAAHLTLQQQRPRDVAAFVAHNPRMLRSVTLNATIHDSAVLQAGAAVQPGDHHPDQGHDRVPAPQRLRDTAGDADRHPRPQPGHRHPARAGPPDATHRDHPRRHPPMGHPQHLAEPWSSADSPSRTTASPPPTPTGRAGKDPRSPGPSVHSCSCSPVAKPPSSTSPARAPTPCVQWSPDPSSHVPRPRPAPVGSTALAPRAFATAVGR